MQQAQIEYIVNCLKYAKITWSDAAKYIFPINRQTLYRWIYEGVEPRNRFLFETTINCCHAIVKATVDGKFPLEKMGKEERIEKIKMLVNLYSD
jgi:hypothetical protein